MNKNFDIKKLNFKWNEIWEKKKYFNPDYKKKKKYCLTIPPPNITGRLHMGHAFQCTIMDFLIRYYRMKKYSTLWKMGTDHAGIASQIIIEKKTKNNKKKHKIIKKWKKKSKKNIIKQLKEMGCSLNWSTKRFTLDNHFSYAVKKVFIDLYKEKLIYKKKTIINWDVKLKTAISDLEIIHKKIKSKLYYIKYNIENSEKNIIIATSRPETLFADSAIAISNKDNINKKILNKNVFIPIINKKIPIIEDKNVDSDFGTGFLKVTPGHDFNDFEIGKRNNLEIINIFNKDGTLNENTPERFRNLSIENARKKIIEELKKNKKILKILDYETKLPYGDRTNNLIEPLITDQWFLKVSPLIKPIKNLIENNKIKIIPFKWKKIFINWIDNIKDWCISRQIWWGHRIPIWYDKTGKIYTGFNEKYLKKKYNIKSELRQEKDVLDTWFSSALWPFVSLGWPNNKKEFNQFYPTKILVTGFDIIFFWVIRMLMLGLKFTKKIPFKEVYIHGLIRDECGSKMSKTKGNVIDPIDIINGINLKDLIKKQTKNLINDKIKDKIKENTIKQFPNGINQFGTDPLRMTFLSMATDNMNLNLNIKNLKKYKNFCNKIWNASILIKNTKKIYKKINLIDKWILSKWEKTKKNINININSRKFSNVMEIIYNFTWNEFCSWYLEMIKTKKNKKNKSKNIFNEIIKVIHPIAPFITSEIWENLNGKKNLMTLSFPVLKNNNIDIYSERKIEILKKIILNIRNSKNEKEKIIFIKMKNINTFFLFEKNKDIVKNLSKVKKIYVIYKKSIKLEKNKILKDIYLYTEKKNIKVNLEKIKKKINEISKKLKNNLFLKRAPKKIILKNKIKIKELKNKIKNLE